MTTAIKTEANTEINNPPETEKVEDNLRDFFNRSY